MLAFIARIILLEWLKSCHNKGRMLTFVIFCKFTCMWHKCVVTVRHVYRTSCELFPRFRICSVFGINEFHIYPSGLLYWHFWRTVREPSDNKAALIILVNWSHEELIWWLQKRQTEQVSILSTVCLDMLCPVLNTWAIKYDLIPTRVFCWPSYSTARHQARHAYYSYMSEIGIIAATWHGKCVRPVSKLITGSDSGSTLSHNVLQATLWFTFLWLLRSQQATGTLLAGDDFTWGMINSFQHISGE